MIRVGLPFHLRTLAQVGEEVALEVPSPATLGAVLEALEACFPALRGAIRDHDGGPRRPFVRFYACQEDLSHAPYSTVLPAEIQQGEEPLLIIGAMAGG